jgi:hypothetical protein
MSEFDINLIPSQLLEKRFKLHENGYDYTLPSDVIVTLHFSLEGQLESVSYEKKDFVQEGENQ